jgi:para-aminobenzoate synthetase component 2
MAQGPAILVIDNYDSFVYNLVQYLAELGASVTVRRNDEVTLDDVALFGAEGVLISPGPGHPRSAGKCLEIIHWCAERSQPLLGVCLGHQAIGEAFGAQIVPAPELVHGRASFINHNGEGIFSGAPQPLIAGRYHSLIVDATTLPEVLEVTATSGELIMGLRHRVLPIEGVQFHPESVLTEDGYLLLANWLERCGASGAVERSRSLSERANSLRALLPEPSNHSH